jgi:hypothetical protein
MGLREGAGLVRGRKRRRSPPRAEEMAVLCDEVGQLWQSGSASAQSTKKRRICSLLC